MGDKLSNKDGMCHNVWTFGVYFFVRVCVNISVDCDLMGPFVTVIVGLLSCQKVVTVNEGRSQAELNYS